MTKIFKIVTPSPKEECAANKISADNIIGRYASIKVWAHEKVVFQEKQRHKHVLLVACECNRWGLKKENILSLILNDYTEDGFSEQEIRSIVDSVYKNYTSEFGKFLIEPPIMKDNEKKEWVTAAEIRAMEMPKERYLVENYIRKYILTLISAPPGIGKSTMVRQLFLFLIYKLGDFLGLKLFGQFYRGIYCSYEDSCMETKESFDKQMSALGVKPDGRFQFYFPKSKNVSRLIDELDKKIKELNGVDIICIDCYNALYSDLGRDATNTLAQRELVDILQNFCEEKQVTMIALHHPIKAGYTEEPNMRTVSGGGGIIERARAILSLSELSSQNPECIYLSVSKGNLLKPILRRQYLEISRDDENYIYSSKGNIIPKGNSYGASREVKKQDNIEKKKKIITEIFKANGSIQHGQFCELYKERTGLSLVSGARHLAEMVNDNVILHDEKAGLYSLKESTIELAPIEEEDANFPF